MAQNIATLAVQFTADTTGLKAGTASAQNLLSQFGNSSQNLGGIFGKVGESVKSLIYAYKQAGPAGAAIEAGMQAVAFGAMAAHKAFDQFLFSAERIDKTSKLAERLDLTYGSLQKLSFIAGRSDVEVMSLAKAMEHMGREMGSGGMSLEARFAEQAKRIGAIKDPAERAAAAFKTFGKAGGELVPLLKNFAADAARFDRFGGKFGFGIEDKDAKNIERMNDAWGDLVFIGTQLADKFVSKFGGPVATFLENAIDMTVDWADTLGELGVTWVDVQVFALGMFGTINDGFVLANGLIKQQIGFALSLLGTYREIQGFLTSDKSLSAKGKANIKTGNKLALDGLQDASDVFSGKTRMDFMNRIGSGTDTSPRGGFGGGGDGSSFGPSGFPKALERGSAGAYSAVLEAGGNPLGAVPPLLSSILQKLESIDDRGRTESRGTIVLSPARG